MLSVDLLRMEVLDMTSAGRYWGGSVGRSALIEASLGPVRLLRLSCQAQLGVGGSLSQSWGRCYAQHRFARCCNCFEVHQEL